MLFTHLSLSDKGQGETWEVSHHFLASGLKKKQTLKTHFWTSSQCRMFLFEEVIIKLLPHTLKRKPQLAALTVLLPWNGTSGGRRRWGMSLGGQKQQRWARTCCGGTSPGLGLSTKEQHMKRKGPVLLQRNDLKQRQSFVKYYLNLYFRSVESALVSYLNKKK